MNKKQITSLFLTALIIFLPIEIANALSISNVRTEETTQVSTKVKWETSTQSEGSVDYGNSKSLGKTKSSPNFIKDHSILLTNLAADTRYYFEVKANDGTNQIIDNNNNNYYEFVTLPKAPLFVNASIPLYYNQGHTISIAGKSIRLARINMYINQELPRTLNADNNGNFLFPDVNLKEGDNRIRLTAESEGNTIQNNYEITVDTLPPAIILTEIPNIVGKEKIIINGSVNEPVTMFFYARTEEEDIMPPPKVLNLKNTSVKPNLVELSWDAINDTDFAQYIVYRNDKPLGIGHESSYNDYTDVLANSGQTYTYQVAAMDKNGNIGERSDPIKVKTPPGGRTDLPEEPVNIYEGISGLQKAIETDNMFQEEIDLDKDGFYKIKIEAVDIAGNEWIYEKEILLDTKDPEIEIIFPKRNAEIYESYADMVTIRGKTEPGARVYLYSKRTPFGILNDTWDIYGFPNEIQQIPEADLRANCRLEIQGEEQCRTHADYETVADAQGYFEFENVDLTSMWAGAFRITEYPTGAPYYQFIREQELKDFMVSNLFFIAVDLAGRKGTEIADYRIRSCWSPSITWSTHSLIEYQSPTFLNIERIKEGTETIYFYFNFTYLGRGKDGKITNLHVADACGRNYLEEKKRYNYSCSILRSCTEKLSPSGKTAYVACPLGRLEGIEKWTDDEWETFVDVVKDEMSFPFKVTLTYDEYFENRTIEYAKTHFLCTEINYVVDAARINPKDVLPDWLLYDFADFLNKTIDKLNDWISKIRRILEWASIGCMATFFVKFVTQVYRRITCHYDRFFKQLQKIGGEKEQQEDDCRICIEEKETPATRKNEILKMLDSNKDIQNLISDSCLQVCYPSCAAAWESEESLYTTYRWICDRVFGHTTPSRWTETKDDTELFQKLSAGEGCSNDQSVRGRPLRAIKCQSVEDKYDDIRGEFGIDDKCLEITTLEGIGRGEESLYVIEGPAPIGENVYKINHKSGRYTLRYDHVIKQNEDNYLAPMEQTCEQLCKGELTGKVQEGLTAKIGGQTFTADKGLNSEKLNEKESMVSGCITPNECISYLSGDQRTIQLKNNQEQKNVDVKTAIPMGYTRDCWDPSRVSGDPNVRIECCCINSETGAFPEYYQPGDIENKDEEFSSEGYENMKWSYRYNKINYKNKRYNENRYIRERDYPACFGQNHWLYDGFAAEGEGNLPIIDPAKQFAAAFQCVAISQVLNRLALIQNIMVAMRNCLFSIRTTGEADTGVCKEIFTQYICAFVWKIITWIRDGCLPFGSGIDFTKSENKILEAVSVGSKGIFDSVADSQQELASEYGNAQLHNLIGAGEEEVFRKVCLGAFGYDWEIDADSLVDIAYHTPFATLVHTIIPPSREYLTFDPTTGNAKYEYRAGWMLNPGCDLDNYEVYLTCVTRNDMYRNDDIDCSKQKDPYGINCDCLDLSPEKAPVPRFYYQGRARIKQNQLVQVDSTQIGGYQRIQTAPYRYDHLMFKLNVDRNYIKNQGDVSKCFPAGHEDGIFYFPIMDYTAREVAGCSLDIPTGIFSCKEGASFFYEQGMATIDGVDLDKDGKYYDDILQEGKKYAATFYKGRAIQGKVKYSKDDRLQCLAVRLYDENKQPFKEGVLAETHVYPLRKSAEGDTISFNTGYIVNEKDITGRTQAITVVDNQLATKQPLETGETKWILHIDIRSPKEDKNCEAVKGLEYDSSQIVVVDGIKQERDIPILLSTTQRSDKDCALLPQSKYDPISEDKKCICGDSYVENCPESDSEHYYCVMEQCRKYPLCQENKVQGACVCRDLNDPDKYDCGYDSRKPENGWVGDDEEGIYCVNEKCLTQEEYNNQQQQKTTLTQKAVIQLDGSKIEDSTGAYPTLNQNREITVNSNFRIQIFVDGGGKEVNAVVVDVDKGETFYLKDAPQDKRKGFWKDTITAPKQATNLRIHAKTVDNKETDIVTQKIKVVE